MIYIMQQIQSNKFTASVRVLFILLEFYLIVCVCEHTNFRILCRGKSSQRLLFEREV
jgi:hypothetical protein